MKICPHCSQENPKGRVLCVHCGRKLEKETKTRTIINSVWGVIGGFVLILFDTDRVLSVGHVIPIPYGYSFIGVSVILYCLENIINLGVPSSLLWADNEPSIQPDERHLLRAIVFGLIAGLMPAVFWYKIATLSNYHFGVLAILVGWAIGKFVAIGSRQRREFLVQSTSVVLSLSVLTLTEYFIVRYVFIQTLSPEKIASLPIFLPVSVTISLLGVVWKNEPITVLFWVIALGLAFAVPGGLYINKPYAENKPNEAEQIQ